MSVCYRCVKLCRMSLVYGCHVERYVQVDENSDFIRYPGQLLTSLEPFHPQNERLFALSSGKVLKYPIAEEKYFFTKLLQSQSHINQFLRLSITDTTKNQEIILEEFIACIHQLRNESPHFYMRWYQTEIKRYHDDFALDMNIDSLAKKGSEVFTAGHLPEAISFFSPELKLAMALNLQRRMCQILNNIGIAYQDLEDFHKATHYYRLGITTADQINEPELKLKSLGHMATIYFLQNNLTLAKDVSYELLSLSNTEVLDGG